MHTFTRKVIVRTDNKGGERLVEIMVSVDDEAIAKKLGGRAFHSKSGKAVYMHGAVVVKADRR